MNELEQARRSGALDELGAAFQAWAEDHGVIWFDGDLRLAQEIAVVLGIEFALAADQGSEE